MKVGIDARPLASPSTGIGRYLIELLRRLSELEHEWILYSDRKVDLPRDIEVSRQRHGNISKPGLSTPFAQANFARWANRDRLDVFWSPRHHLPAGLRMPSVVTIHDLVWCKTPSTMIRLGWFAERLLMPYAMTNAARILVPSNSTAQDIAEHFPTSSDRVRVVPLGVSLVARKPPVQRACEPYMLVVGTIEPRKNHARILDAFEAITARGNVRHRLVVVGSAGWKCSEVLERLRNKSDSVIYTGPVNDDELICYYTNADFVVAPSLYEGFGLQVLEAMSFGKPVITANISSMPEVGGDAALLVDPYSVAQIANAMLTLIENRALHATYSRRAQQRATNYSWDQAALQTKGVLEEASRV